MREEDEVQSGGSHSLLTPAAIFIGGHHDQRRTNTSSLEDAEMSCLCMSIACQRWNSALCVVFCRYDRPRRGGQSRLLSRPAQLHRAAQSFLGEPRPDSR